MIIKAAMWPKFIQNLETLLIYCQTPFPANRASPNNSVSCCGISFGEGQDKFRLKRSTIP